MSTKQFSKIVIIKRMAGYAISKCRIGFACSECGAKNGGGSVFCVIDAACRAICAASLDAPSNVTPMVSEMAIFALAMSSGDNDCVFTPRARSARIRASGGLCINRKRHRTDWSGDAC